MTELDMNTLVAAIKAQQELFPQTRIIQSDWRSAPEVQELLRYATQATWSLNETNALIVGLVIQLVEAEAAAADGEETQKKLKGLQLENGRLKAQLAKLKGNDGD